MAQVNIALDDHAAAALDRIAQSKGVRRSELLRSAINELIEAHDGGRLAFQSDAGPKLDASVSGLVHQLRESVIELDRAQADNARLFGKLIEMWNGGEEANRIAIDHLTDMVRQRNIDGYLPFVERMKKVLAAVTATPSDVTEALKPHIDRIAQQLEANNKLVRVPRRQYAVFLSDNRWLTLGVLSIAAAVFVVFGGVLTVALSSMFDATAVGNAARMIGSPAQMCRLIEREYGVTDCKLPENERDLGLRVIAHEAGR